MSNFLRKCWDRSVDFCVYFLAFVTMIGLLGAGLALILVCFGYYFT